MRKSSRILIVGAGGRLGAALVRFFGSNFHVTGLARAQLDLANPDQIASTLPPLDFDLLINCAAQTNVDRCEEEPREALALNAEAPGWLAEICTEKKARLIHLSTDYVFDGEKTEPYTEEDEPNPLSVYGASKLEGERRVLAANADHLVVRVSWVFGPDRPSFIDWIIQQAREKDEVAAIADKFSTPSYTLDLAEMLRALWDRREGPLAASGGGTATGPGAGRLQGEGERGLLHLANGGSCSWQEYGQWALDCCAEEGVPLRAKSVGAIALAGMKQFIARRPAHTALATGRYEALTGKRPRAWREAVREYVREHVAPAMRAAGTNARAGSR